MQPDVTIAAIVTTYFPHSHADVIVTRWLEPRESDRDWGWNAPQSRIASLYVAQIADPALDTTEFNGRDLSRELAAKHNLPMFDTIREALTLGGETLAVDAVLLVGEHGHYPYNEWGQKLYPRKEFFDAIVAVFRESGRSVPVFCDKHLSWNGAWAQEMVETARALGFPLMAGSSLPHVGAEPDPEVIAGGDLEAYVGLFYCGAEVYGFHSLELMQSLIETRQGGESGVVALTAYEGEAVWEAMERGVWSKALFEAALAASRQKITAPLRDQIAPNPEFPGRPGLVAFHFEHADGLTATHIMLHGCLNDFTFALNYRGEARIRAGCSLVGAGDPSNHFGHFAALNSAIEEMFLTGEASIPVERTLLTTRAIECAMHALHAPGVRLETPELRLPYAGKPTPRKLSPNVRLTKP